MGMLADIKVPDVVVNQMDNKKYMQKIVNYLQSLDESIRYAIGHIDDENITKKFIEDLVVGHLLITNGDNSIIGNPAEGLKMLVDNKTIIDFNLRTGKAKFVCDIVGGSIQSENFISGVSGTKIDLTNGSIDTKNMKVDSDGNAEFNGNIIGGSIQSENYVADVSGMKINLTEGTLDTKNVKVGSDGSAVFTGDVIGSNIVGSWFYGDGGSETEVLISASYGQQVMVDISPSQIEMTGAPDTGGYLLINVYTGIETPALKVDGSDVLTKNNYASNINTSQLTPTLTEAGNINFAGPENAAAVNWVQLYYYSKLQADERFELRNHTHDYVTDGQLTNAMTTVDNNIRAWVTANFAPKV